MNGDPSLESTIIQAGPQAVWMMVFLFSGLVVSAAITDIRRYMIPNWIPAAIALLWCVWALLVPIDPVASLVVCAVVFAAGAVLFAFRALGGGDVKLLAAVSLWAGYPEVLTLIFQIAIAGGVLAVLWILSGRVRVALAYYGVPVSVETPVPTQVPYGVAIAAGGLLLAARLAGL